MNEIIDVRDYLDALDKVANLRRVDHVVDPNLELGATIRLSYEGRDNPHARVALSLGLAAEVGPRQIREQLAAATQRAPIAPVVRYTGPVHQNMLLGESASLANFPKPIPYEETVGPTSRTFGPSLRAIQLSHVRIIFENDITAIVRVGRWI